jgi:glycosyltransferase involved in cell wall biosynthesis
MKKVSLVATVYNEAESIRQLLSSITSSVRLPDECVLVDAGSSDGTVEIIREFTRDHAWATLHIAPGVNIARGRNIAIQSASYDIIAMTDGGTSLDPEWLSRLVAPMEYDDAVDVVAGWTVMQPQTGFEQWVSLIQRPPDSLDMQTYLPSARSLALRKSVWQVVGGFPESLTKWAEDSVFMLRVREKGFNVVLKPEARVYWRPRATLGSYWTQYFHYGYGDAEGRLFLSTYSKRFVLLCSAAGFVIGMIVSRPLALVSGVILAAGFVRLMLPLHSKTVSIWKLMPLYGLVLFSETAKMVGYLWARMGFGK